MLRVGRPWEAQDARGGTARQWREVAGFCAPPHRRLRSQFGLAFLTIPLASLFTGTCRARIEPRPLTAVNNLPIVLPARHRRVGCARECHNRHSARVPLGVVHHENFLHRPHSPSEQGLGGETADYATQRSAATQHAASTMSSPKTNTYLHFVLLDIQGQPTQQNLAPGVRGGSSRVGSPCGRGMC